MENEVHSPTFDTRERFAFGGNWKRFLSVLDDQRIATAETSLKKMLGVDNLRGKRFLDAGSGSGLFSLCARRLGATVHSFDYDPQSVACTKELRNRYFSGDDNWMVEEASVLDLDYLKKLGEFDVVYSWGVLHHTGAMFQALENITKPVAPRGKLLVAIYNDQGWLSRYWKQIKLTYVRHRSLRWPLLLFLAPYLLGARWLVRTATGRRKVERGMALWHDMVDWVGGYPFEVAKPEAILHFYRDRGFLLYEMSTCAGRHGCNEFVFGRQQIPLLDTAIGNGSQPPAKTGIG